MKTNIFSSDGSRNILVNNDSLEGLHLALALPMLHLMSMPKFQEWLVVINIFS